MRGFRAEPVAVTAAIRACLMVAMSFGLGWTAEQLAAVMLAVELVLALFLRGQVTSERTLDAAGTSGHEVRGVAGASGDVRMAVVSQGRQLQDWERDQ